MKSFNKQKFNTEIEKRLDEIFLIEKKICNNTEKENKMINISPFYNLRKILLTMEWEVTDDILSKYLSEIIQLRRLFRENIYLKCLLHLQYIYGKFIKTYPDKIPLKTYKLLYSLHGCMKNILVNKKLSDSEKKKIVKQEIHRYKNFRKYITTNNNSLSQKKSFKKATPTCHRISYNMDSKNIIKNATFRDELSYKDYLENALLEMKAFIKREIEELKFDLCNLQSGLQNGRRSLNLKTH